MTVTLALLVGLVVAWGLGARLSLLARLDFRGDWLVFAALGIQIVLFTSLFPPVPQRVETALHAATYVMLMTFLLLNRRISGFWMVGVGVVSNVTVIFANGGYMPVSLDAWRATGADPALITHTGHFQNNVLAGVHTHLSFLGDVFALPAVVPLANALSVGDVLVVLGMVAFVYRTCSPRPESAVGGAALLAPLRYRDFRRVVAGRLTSKLGDWLTQAAAVTWIYSSTRSTFGVSAFLLVRIFGVTLGGIAAAPLLDRLPGFRLLSLVEAARGVLAAGMLAAAVTGHVWPVIILSAMSAFLSSATAPGASSLVPDVLPPELLQAGNSLHGVARNLMLVVGAFSGGFLVTQFGIGTALSVDITTFVAAAVLYSRFDGVAVIGVEEDEEPGGVGTATRRELLRTLFTNRVVFGLTASFTVVTAVFGMLNSSLSQVFDQQLGDPHAYGYALAVLGAGLMCGELLTGFIQRESVARRTVSLAFLSIAGMLIVIAHSHVQATMLLMVFMLGASDGTTEIVYDTLIQIHTPRRMLAGVFAIASSVQNTGMMIGLAAAPFFLVHGGVVGVMRLIAVGCIVGAAVAAAALVGRRPPAEQDDADVIRRDRRPESVARPVTGLAPTPVALPAAALGESVAAVPVCRAANGPVTVAGLLDGVPLVLASAGTERRTQRTEMLSELSERLSELGCRVVSVTELTAEAAMGGTGHGGVWMVDPAGVLRFAFAATGPDEWIPASFVVSRLRRLNGTGSGARVA